MIKYKTIAESSNGRTADSGSAYWGSNPCSAALLRSTHQGLRPYCNKSEEGSEELNDEEYLFQSLHPSLCSGFRPSSLYVIEKGKLKTLRNLDEGEMTKCHNVFMSYIVYVLECADKSYYVGCTNDLEKRLKQHNESRWGAHYTKIRRPVILKYSEEFKTLIEARRREAEIKGWRRRKKEKLWIAT